MSDDITIGQFDQWRTTCPKCKGGPLIVSQARLAANGKKIKPNTRLHADGFEVDPEGKYDRLKDQSTEDERVTCTNCNAKFDLSDLALD